MTRFWPFGLYVVVRALATTGISVLLAGCMLDGFNLLPEFRASDAGATEPVPSLRTYRVGSNTQKDPLLYIRFVRVDANQYAMEQFAQDGNDAVFQAHHATLVPLDGAWHMLFWRDTRSQLQGVQLVRFGSNSMEVAEVAKFGSQIARLGPAAGTEVLKLLGGSGLTLQGATPQQLPGFLRAVVNLPGLSTLRLTATDSVPADLRNRAMNEMAPQFAALDARDAADPARAQRMLNYFRVLHSEGIGLGTYAYARAAYHGWGMPRDTRVARELANRAVALGVPRANTLLGVMAWQGIDEPADRTRALSYYELGAKAGDGAAFTNLGFAYLGGDGVTKDATRAAQWFERGASENSMAAIVQLADMVLDGLGVAKDDKRAVALLDRAVGGSDPHGTALRAWMYALGRGGPADQVKASELFLKAAQLGSGFGQWQIGYRLVEGIGVAANREQGMKWLAQAAAAGVSEARDAMEKLTAPTVTAKQPDSQATGLESLIEQQKQRLERETAALKEIDKRGAQLSTELAVLVQRRHATLLAARKAYWRERGLLAADRSIEGKLLKLIPLLDEMLTMGGSAQQRTEWQGKRDQGLKELRGTRASMARLEGAHPEILGWRLPNGQVVVTRPDGVRVALKSGSSGEVNAAELPRKGDQFVRDASAQAFVHYEQSWTGVPSEDARIIKLAGALNALIGKYSCERVIIGLTLSFRNTAADGPAFEVDVNGVARLRSQIGDGTINQWRETEEFAPLGRIGDVELQRRESRQCSSVLARCDKAASQCQIGSSDGAEVSTSGALAFYFADATNAARAAELLRELVDISR